jgi:hypothetical protein
MRVSILRSATCTAVLLAAVWATSSAAQRPSRGAAAARSQPRTCAYDELQTQPAVEGPQRVAAAGGRVSLVPPEGLRLLTRAEAEEVFGDVELAIADEREAAAMSLALADFAPDVDSPEFRADMERRAWASGSVSSWIGTEVVELGGARWLRLEYTGRLDGSENRSQVYMTGFQGGALVMMLLALEPEWMPRLVTSAATLEVRDCKLPPPPLAAFLDSTALVRAVSALPAPDLPRGVKPLFRVSFDSTGAVDDVEPISSRIPAGYAGPVRTAIRAHLKPQAPSRGPINTYLRVVAGPEPLVDRPTIVVREPVLANRGGIQGRIGELAARFEQRLGGTEIPQPRVGFLRRLLLQAQPRPSRASEFLVRMRVLADGAVDTESIEILRSSSRDEEVKGAVVHIAGLMRFRPATVEGMPASVWVTLPIVLQY